MNQGVHAVFCIADKEQTVYYAELLRKYAEEENIPLVVEIFNNFQKLEYGLLEKEDQTDLLFVDTVVNGRAGARTIEALRKKKFNGTVIFLTAKSDEWETAFDIQAFHYVIQGKCKEERFRWILSKAFEKIQERKQEMIVFTCAGERVVTAVKDIKYYEVRERWIIVHYQKEQFEFFSRMGKVEQTMMGKGFVRVHRSYLVCMDYVESIRFEQLTLLDGTEIPIGRGKYQEVKVRFESIERGERM